MTYATPQIKLNPMTIVSGEVANAGSWGSAYRHVVTGAITADVDPYGRPAVRIQPTHKLASFTSYNYPGGGSGQFTVAFFLKTHIGTALWWNQDGRYFGGGAGSNLYLYLWGGSSYSSWTMGSGLASTGVWRSYFVSWNNSTFNTYAVVDGVGYGPQYNFSQSPAGSTTFDLQGTPNGGDITISDFRYWDEDLTGQGATYHAEVTAPAAAGAFRSGARDHGFGARKAFGRRFDPPGGLLSNSIWTPRRYK
jgi:hypothetical protein